MELGLKVLWRSLQETRVCAIVGWSHVQINWLDGYGEKGLNPSSALMY